MRVPSQILPNCRNSSNPTPQCSSITSAWNDPTYSYDKYGSIDKFENHQDFFSLKSDYLAGLLTLGDFVRTSKGDCNSPEYFYRFFDLAFHNPKTDEEKKTLYTDGIEALRELVALTQNEDISTHSQVVKIETLARKLDGSLLDGIKEIKNCVDALRKKEPSEIHHHNVSHPQIFQPCGHPFPGNPLTTGADARPPQASRNSIDSAGPIATIPAGLCETKRLALESALFYNRPDAVKTIGKFLRNAYDMGKLALSKVLDLLYHPKSTPLLLRHADQKTFRAYQDVLSGFSEKYSNTALYGVDTAEQRLRYIELSAICTNSGQLTRLFGGTQSHKAQFYSKFKHAIRKLPADAQIGLALAAATRGTPQDLLMVLSNGLPQKVLRHLDDDNPASRCVLHDIALLAIDRKDKPGGLAKIILHFARSRGAPLPPDICKALRKLVTPPSKIVSRKPKNLRPPITMKQIILERERPSRPKKSKSDSPLPIIPVSPLSIYAWPGERTLWPPRASQPKGLGTGIQTLAAAWAVWRRNRISSASAPNAGLK